ncbi:MAG: Gfo/Idh/MocA family oxidoreductase [Armatimonadetes bacterium]|nr:Gfo/Idh/MocA family oxidoreductase [Armatimonadota bacterium]
MYKVAILGCGNHGKGHDWNKIPDCQLVAVCDIVEQRARDRAETYGVPYYLDADEMFDKEEIDIVDAPVREKDRFTVVMKCLTRNKHVFTEKPLGGEEGQYRVRLNDIPKVRAIMDEWQKRDVQLGICFTMHGTNTFRWAEQVIRSTDFGALTVVDARCTWGAWNHLLDMFRYLGGEVDEVFAHADAAWQSKTVSVKFANGAVGNVMTSNRLWVPYVFEVKWVAEKGQVHVEDLTDAWARTGDGRSAAAKALSVRDDPVLGQKCDGGTMRVQHMTDFVASIKERRRFVADGWAGMRHMEIDAAITESILSGQPVKIERYQPEQGRTIFSK